MIEYLKELLNDFEICENNKVMITINISNAKQKVLALETAIEVLEKLKNNERSVLNGNIK